jgi:hypothetical protein
MRKLIRSSILNDGKAIVRAQARSAYALRIQPLRRTYCITNGYSAERGKGGRVCGMTANTLKKQGKHSEAAPMFTEVLEKRQRIPGHE